MPACTRPRGISLMEVLISMGVVAIGLVGAISLMPVAGNSAATAALETRKGLFGRRAIDEFHTRGMNDPRSWVTNNGTRWVTPGNHFGGTQPLRSAYAIDPLYVQLRGNANFPEKHGGGARMRRVTLRAPYMSTPMTTPMIREIFDERDQLDLVLPDDKTLPVEQQFDVNTTNNTLLRRRIESKGYSWFATLVREDILVPEKYKLSIIVMYNRVIPAPPDPPDEFALAAVPLGNGYGGGRWELTDLNQILKADPLRPNSTVSSLQPGEWVMLAQVRTQADGTTEDAFVWYRIADVAQYNNTTQKVIVTLDGPDWPVGILGGGNVTATVYPGGKNYEGVVAVYEKTITLETTPLWVN